MHTVLDQPGLFYPDVIAQNARYFANKDAVVFGESRLSWSEFHFRTNRVANALIAGGLRKGDRVCLLMLNSIAMFELIWGVIKAGGVVVPLNVLMANEALPVMLNNAGPRAVFADSHTVAQLSAVRHKLLNAETARFLCFGYSDPSWEPAEAFVDAGMDTTPKVKLEPSDSMNIIYSSGTTGIPKGIEHSHQARLVYPCGYGPGLRIDRFTRTVCTTPLYTNGTWITMLPTVFWGGAMILMDKFSGNGFLETVEKERGTHSFMVPTQYISVIDAAHDGNRDASSLLVLLTGGQNLPSSVAEKILRLFPTTGLYETYGMTEGFLTLAIPGDRKIGKGSSVGMGFCGCDIRVIGTDGVEVPAGESGEIVGRSPGLMKGYFKDPVRTAEIVWRDPDGRTFIRSGDIGRFDADGYLYVTGRIKDMIKSGGINIFATDIEEIFTRHPEVAEAAAIGIPHEKWGETPIIFVIRRPGSAISPDELKAWGNEQLGRYQRVSEVIFCDDFPRATYGKVKKDALRAPYLSRSF